MDTRHNSEPGAGETPEKPGLGAGAHPGSGLLLIVSGPSGVGKSTIIGRLRRRFPQIGYAVSATTRPQAQGETDGVEYFFLSGCAFAARVAEGAFLEHAEYAGNRYGTLKSEVGRLVGDGRLVTLDIDVQGARSVKAALPEAYAIFLLPPSDGALLERLTGRGRDDEHAIRRRYDQAQREISQARAWDVYDAFVVNDDLGRAVEEAAGLIEARLGLAT